MTKPITSIILAGGKSSRMGKDKALLTIKGKPIIKYVFESLIPFSSDIIISSNSDDYNFLNTKIVPDLFKNIGPISGIYSCLLESKNEINVITSCDTPLLNPELFLYLLEKHGHYEVTNPIHEKITEPIIGVFNKQIFNTIKNNIENTIYSPPKIFTKLNQQFVNIDTNLNFYSSDMFLSANTRDDFNKIIQLIST